MPFMGYYLRNGQIRLVRFVHLIRLLDEQTVNGFWKIAWISVFRFPFETAVYIYSSIYTYILIYICLYVYI
jgi:hypothetical protein